MVNCTTVIDDSSDDDNQKFYKAALGIYRVGIPTILAICLISIAINARCLAATRWIRGPVSPTLMLSLSLAAADLYSSLLLLINLTLHSYLPIVWEIELNIWCTSFALEGVRLGGIITLVGHLTALAINHHLGIVRPLKYPGMLKSLFIYLY